MEVGTEISQKIRSAIKAKLLELGSYVDDELPDYIMVMVANKKSRSQMNGDLGLFLGTNTDIFTEWLHGLLEKLQTITIDPDKYSGKQGKTEKPKPSKEKKKDKEPSQKGESSVKRSSKDAKDKTDKKKGSESVTTVSDRVPDSNVGLDETKVNSSCTDEHSDKHNLGSESEKLTVKISSLTSSSGSNVITVENQISERHKNIVEDVRQLLVTETAEDELAEELETTEVEVLNLRKVKDTERALKESAKTSGLSSKDIISTNRSASTRLSSTSRRSQSPVDHGMQDPAVARKRKAPTSVVATVSKRDGGEEEYDPHNPAFGTVASVVKVTARKSSVPPLMQANRLLLLKAMTEAERSVAAKKKVIVAKPVSRDNSPAEVYSPKRKLPRDQDSPPLYIPSRKDAISRRAGRGSIFLQHSDARVLARDDARHVLNRDNSHELTSRSRREKTLQTVDLDKDSSHRRDPSRSPEKSKRQREGEKIDREVKSDRDSKGGKNFQITCHLSSNPVAVVSHPVDNRKRQHSSSPEPEQHVQVTISSIPTQDSKSASSRLGKLVIERNGSQEDDRKAVDTRYSQPVASTRQRDAREDINAKAGSSKSKEILGQKSSGRVISNLGMEAFQKQCEAAVISVQAAEKTSRAKRNTSPDSRVVKCDIQVVEEEKAEKDVEKRKESSSLKSDVPAEAAVGGGSSGDDDDDLSKMIDEDLGPELLDNTNGDDYSLDLDIDEDLSHVVGTTEDDVTGSEVRERGKDEKKLGTRFIVTLDGVDERQFNAENNSSSNEKFKHPPTEPVPTVVAPVAVSVSEHVQYQLPVYPFPVDHKIAAEQFQQSQNLYLELLGSQGRSLSQAALQHVQSLVAAVPSKLTPPKIQPFSISLKDSDDEHEDKDGKPSAPQEDYYPEPEGDVAVKRAKLSERCKFWPACSAGAACEYHHPTAHCKTFPSCKFGDKCLFIHPNCRFDSKCTRPDCPYTHTSRRAALSSATHVIAIPPPHFAFSAAPPKHKFMGYSSTQTVCHYFPNCTNINCRFLHPKACKFGTSCISTACPFYHPLMPGKNKLKWQASSGQVKPEEATTPSLTKLEPIPAKLSPTTTSSSATVSSTSQ